MENIVIRRAELKDAEYIYTIHKKWRDDYFELTKDKKGMDRFLSPYTLDQITKISEEGYACIALVDGIVASYYFVNPFFETGNVGERKIIIQQKITDGYLPDGKYAFSLQSATDENYTGRGLNRNVLKLVERNNER